MAKSTKKDKPKPSNKMVSEAANKNLDAENGVEINKGETLPEKRTTKTDVKEDVKEAKKEEMVKCHVISSLHGKDKNGKQFYFPCTITRKAGKVVKDPAKAVMVPLSIAKNAGRLVEIVK